MKKNTLNIISGVLLLLLITTGLSFAYFSATIEGVENTTTIFGKSGVLKIVYNGGSNIDAEGIVPSNDPFGTKVFTVTGTNSTNLNLNYHIMLVITKNTYTEGAIKYKLISVNTDGNGDVVPSITDLTEVETGAGEIFLGNGSFSNPASGAVHTYTFEIYFPDTGIPQNEDQGKEINAHIEIREEHKLFLKDKLLVHNGGLSSIIELPNSSFLKPSPNIIYKYNVIGSEYTTSLTRSSVAVGTGYEIDEFGRFKLTGCISGVNYIEAYIGWYTFDRYTCGTSFDIIYQINQVANNQVTNSTKYITTELTHDQIDFDETGLYKMEDDYGDSYYFRGAKELLNNNLIFADHQWKIVRINGDGSIRIIYNGVCLNNDCQILTEGNQTQLPGTPYNIDYDDNKYVGYMYGNTSNSYEEAHANDISSNIKNYLELWYENNIVNKGYASNVADTLFCNNRTPSSKLGFTKANSGYGEFDTIYDSAQNASDGLVKLKCERETDRFTVDDTTNGNGDLEQPIGLLSTDEAVMAGITLRDPNDLNYLSNNTDYRLMTPAYFLSSAAVFVVIHDGTLMDSADVSFDIGLRPVINLKPNLNVTGTGSFNDPYIVLD